MLRVKDVDFARGQLTVRDPTWKHDRIHCKWEQSPAVEFKLRSPLLGTSKNGRR